MGVIDCVEASTTKMVSDKIQMSDVDGMQNIPSHEYVSNARRGFTTIDLE
jgi:hypothetical protein